MKISSAPASTRAWEYTRAYRYQVNDGTVNSQSYYDQFYTDYSDAAKWASTVASSIGVTPQSVVVCGPGSSYEEALLVKEAFPEVERMHFIDWHLPNLELLQRLLEINGSLLPDVELTLQHADLRHLSSNEAFPVDLAYICKVFDLFDGYGQWQILKSISGALAPGGILYSLDHPFPHEADLFNSLALSAGFKEVRNRIYQKT
jgi:hypothetical protein